MEKEILEIRQELAKMREHILHPEWLFKVDELIAKIDEMISRGDPPSNSPIITVDAEAIRFDFGVTGANLFWKDLFIGQRYSSFQAEIMDCLFKAYNLCVKNAIDETIESI